MASESIDTTRANFVVQRVVVVPIVVSVDIITSRKFYLSGAGMQVNVGHKNATTLQ